MKNILKYLLNYTRKMNVIYLYFEIFKLCYEMYILIFQAKDYLYAKYYT